MLVRDMKMQNIVIHRHWRNKWTTKTIHLKINQFWDWHWCRVCMCVRVWHSVRSEKKNSWTMWTKICFPIAIVLFFINNWTCSNQYYSERSHLVAGGFFLNDKSHVLCHHNCLEHQKPILFNFKLNDEVNSSSVCVNNDLYLSHQ